jgi:pimeloyl-ACP methyl ester carboxylesterase
MNTVGEEKIYVFMNAEFVPYLESRYRVIKHPAERFLMGQSSGAWTALWLQFEYPELFAGAFAASPDPVDFRALGFDIYADNSNYYYPPDPDSASMAAGENMGGIVFTKKSGW